MTDEQVRAYLLHELSDEDTEWFEDELFAADAWETDVEAVEDDLIEDYVRGELTAEQRRLFEENFLVTEARRDRVRMATAFIQHADTLRPAAPEKSGWWQRLVSGWNTQPLALRFAAGLAIVLVIAGTVWFVGFRGPREQSYVSLTLPMVSRTRSGEGVKDHVVLRGEELLKLKLLLPDPVSNTAIYAAEMSDGSGQMVPLNPVTREGGNLLISIPTSRLKRGTYLITVSVNEPGATPAPLPGDYIFRVD